MASLLLSQSIEETGAGNLPSAPNVLAATLFTDLCVFYGEIASIRSLDLEQIWRIARDLTIAVEKWEKTVALIESGKTKMAVAVEVAWLFIGKLGGTAALRNAVVDALDHYKLGFIAKPLVGLLFTDKAAKALIRLVLELAVRQLWRDQAGEDSHA